MRAVGPDRGRDWGGLSQPIVLVSVHAYIRVTEFDLPRHRDRADHSHDENPA